MKKRIFAVLTALALLIGGMANASASFMDIKDSETAVAAAALESMGIVTGTGTNVYNPDKTLTRAEFAALAVRAMGLEDKVSSHAAKALFSDAPPGKWYTGYVNLAYSEGIINGYGNGKFGPEDTVTYAHVATILLRILGYTETEIGKSWPSDYVAYANSLGLAGGLSLTANTVINRGQAAVLLYNTVRKSPNGSSRAYYETISGVASVETVIVLSNNASSGGNSGYLMVCSVGEQSAPVKYYAQKIKVSDALTGRIGAHLLDSAGRAVGFVPDAGGYKDIAVSSATVSGDTTRSGETIRVTGGASVIRGESVYTYNTTGYLQVDGQAGKSVRFYYDHTGAVSHIYITGGASSSGTFAAVAETNSAASELARNLGITNTSYTVIKNGVTAEKSDLARYDAAYYDAASNTVYASDYKITGYITAASPSVGAAATVTVAGAVLDVLECAWDTLGNFKLGELATLLLTDDNKVAAAYSASEVTAPMLGVLSLDGGSVTLCGSGITLGGAQPVSITAAETLRGGLVKVAALTGSITCSALSGNSSSGRVNLTAGTVNGKSLAPGAEIYENAASGTFVYSLSGIQGEPSYDFAEIYWTDSLSASDVGYYHLNSLGQIDVLLLRDVTGNCYEYGRLTTYEGTSGINLGTSGEAAYNSAVTITNSGNAGGSAKYLYPAADLKNDYCGIALYKHSNGYTAVAKAASLKSATVSANSFFQSGGDWYAVVSGFEIPVSGSVEVLVSTASSWLTGENGVLSAISSGMTLTVYYDRTLATGAQIRLIVAH